MKTKVLTFLSLILFVITGLVVAASERPASPARVRDPQARTVRPATRDRDMAASREQMYREMLSRRTEEHRAAMKELEDIKKLADEEGATKTAQALQKMIDKKNEEFKQATERFNRARRDRAEQIQARQQGEKPNAAKADQKEKGGKDKEGDE